MLKTLFSPPVFLEQKHNQMAVLNKIRQRSVFLIIVIALALFSFVLADVIRNGGMVSQKSRNTIASINGEDIQREEFAKQVEAYQQNLGPNASTMQAVDMVWDLNIRQAVLEAEFEKLGIQVEEAQVKELLRQQLTGNPNFSNEAGMFDENKLQEYVATLKATNPAAYQQWINFEESVGKTARENIYFNLIRAGVGATISEGEKLYRLENDNVDLKFVQVPYTSVPNAEIEVSKAEIKAYMEKHPQEFQTEATRDIRYVLFAEKASSEDQKAVKEDITALLDDRVEYNAVTDANDTILGFKNAEDIAIFVNSNSDVKYVDRFLFKNQLPPENADTLFGLEVGEIFGPYKAEGAWKISKAVAVKEIPDSVKVQHILVSYEGLPIAAGITRTQEEAKALADSIANVVKKDLEQFAPLAAEFSADASNKGNAGELDWFGPGVMVPEFNAYVFSHNEGDIGVIETQFGYHVVHIQEQTEKERAIKIATIVRDIQPSEQSLNNLFAEVTKFEIEAGKGDFAAAAKKINKEARPVKEIKVLEANIPGIGAERSIVQWAFEKEAKVGDIKRFDVREGYVVAQLTEKNKKGLKSVESASATVLPILQKEKKAAIIKEGITEGSLESIAQSQGVSVENATAVNRKNPVLPGAGIEPKVVGAAFGMEKGEVSAPIAGNKGVYSIELLALNKAPELNSYLPFTNRKAAEARAAIGNEVFTALKEKAEIEDNRARFY